MRNDPLLTILDDYGWILYHIRISGLMKHILLLFDPHTEHKANIWNHWMTHSNKAVFLSCVLGVKPRVPVNIIIQRRR